MPIQTNSRLRISWCVLTGTVAITVLAPGAILHDPRFAPYFSSDWIHFLAYAAVGTIALLAWKLRTALATCAGVAVASFVLQILRGLVTGRGFDLDGNVINLLGIAAGILFALHVRRSGWFAKHQPASTPVLSCSNRSRSEAERSSIGTPSPETHQATVAAFRHPKFADHLSIRVTDITVKD